MEIPRCPWHIAKADKLPYGAYHVYSEKMSEKGVKQIQCERCKLYFWPNHYGKKPKEAK